MAHFVPNTIPEIYCLTLPLNSKKLFLKAIWVIFVRSAVDLFWCLLLYKMILRALNPTSWEVEGYNPNMFVVIRMSLLGID